MEAKSDLSAEWTRRTRVGGVCGDRALLEKVFGLTTWMSSPHGELEMIHFLSGWNRWLAARKMRDDHKHLGAWRRARLMIDEWLFYPRHLSCQMEAAQSLTLSITENISIHWSPVISRVQINHKKSQSDVASVIASRHNLQIQRSRSHNKALASQS